jgi:hypothetical protein
MVEELRDQRPRYRPCHSKLLAASSKARSFRTRRHRCSEYVRSLWHACSVTISVYCQQSRHFSCGKSILELLNSLSPLTSNSGKTSPSMFRNQWLDFSLSIQAPSELQCSTSRSLKVPLTSQPPILEWQLSSLSGPLLNRAHSSMADWHGRTGISMNFWPRKLPLLSNNSFSRP